MLVPWSSCNGRGAEGATALTGICGAVYDLELFTADSRERAWSNKLMFYFPTVSGKSDWTVIQQ